MSGYHCRNKIVIQVAIYYISTALNIYNNYIIYSYIQHIELSTHFVYVPPHLQIYFTFIYLKIYYIQ